MPATVLDQLREEIARSREAPPIDYGAWGVHAKALAADKGVKMLGGGGGGIAWGEKTTVTGLPGTQPVTPYYTGPTSLFGVMGAERDIISTRVQPRGLSGSLPAIANNNMIPYFPYLTGFLADTGSEPEGACDDPITAGPAKSGYQTAQFGRIERGTRTLELTRLGQRINRGEMLDLRLLNDPLLMTGSPTGADITTPQINGNPSIFQETLMRMMEVGISFQNKLSPMTFRGNPANNTSGADASGSPGYMEFPGLDILINTTKLDAFTGAALPSLYSDMKDFGGRRIDDHGLDIVNYITYMARTLRYKADRQNLLPTTWVIAMRQELFYELTAVWPCAYLTYRCTIQNTGTQNELFVNATDQINMRDSLRQGRFLLIDGEQWPVVFDDGIVEYTQTTSNKVPASGCFMSDVYFIPVTVAGGVASTYFEFYDWSGTDAAMAGLAQGNVGQSWFWTDGGRFLWHFQPPQNFCLRWIAVIQPRIILKTPQLAGRVQNVAYCPLQHTPEPFPSDPYFVDGGVSTGRSTTSTLTPYADWRQ